MYQSIVARACMCREIYKGGGSGGEAYIYIYLSQPIVSKRLQTFQTTCIATKSHGRPQ